MNKITLLSAMFLIAVCAIPTSSIASRCYSKVGTACVKKSYGNLDSTCQFACSIGRTAESVQGALKDKSYDSGPIDGIAGKKTEKALRTFQGDQNLPQTGRMDKVTLEKLGVELK